jgi:hypothetical protein
MQSARKPPGAALYEDMALMSANARQASFPEPPEHHIRALERTRLRALVERDMSLAWTLHAPQFQLVTPAGSTLTRDEYLGKIGAGALRYLRWEPEAMAVRMHGAAAVVRYRATLEMDSGGGEGTPFRRWHIDLYERNDAGWHVVWSQATRIAAQQA